MRLAPALRRVMAEQGRYWEGDADVDAAVRELRALLAVARAALGPEGVRPDGCWGYSMKAKRCRCQMHVALEALARLRRAGREGG